MDLRQTIDECKRLVKHLEKFKYGLPGKDGKIHHVKSAKEYDEKYRFLTPEEFKKYGGGICWDYVEYEAEWLDIRNIKARKFYIFTETPPNWDTHTFVVVESKGKYIYIESSFEPMAGVRVCDSIRDIITMITYKMFDMNNNSKHFSQFKYTVFEYTGKHPEYGCTSEEYMNWMADNGKYVMDDVAKLRERETKNVEVKVEHMTFQMAFNESMINNNKTELIPYKNFPFNKVYFGMPEKRSSIILDRPMFCTPYKQIASIFAVSKNRKIKARLSGHYNLGYDEWEYPIKNDDYLDEVHIRVEKSNMKFEPFELDLTGYVYEIDVSDLKDHIYRDPNRDEKLEVLIKGINEIDFDKCHQVNIHTFVRVDDSKHIKESYENIMEATNYRGSIYDTTSDPKANAKKFIKLHENLLLLNKNVHHMTKTETIDHLCESYNILAELFDTIEWDYKEKAFKTSRFGFAEKPKKKGGKHRNDIDALIFEIRDNIIEISGNAWSSKGVRAIVDKMLTVYEWMNEEINARQPIGNRLLSNATNKLTKDIFEKIMDSYTADVDDLVYTEAKISSKERKELDDSVFGLIYYKTDKKGNKKKVRKYPLTDEEHVRKAVQFFGNCPSEYKKRLARNILKRANELNMDTSNWEKIHDALKD